MNIVVDAQDSVITRLYVTNAVSFFVPSEGLENMGSRVVKICSGAKAVRFE